MKVITAAVLVITSMAATAQWSEVDTTNHGGYFTMTSSTRFNDSALVVYMYPESQCLPSLVNLFKPTEQVEDQEPTGTLIRTRVSNYPIHYINGARSVVNGLVHYEWKLSGKFLREFLEGESLIFDLGENGPVTTDSFSLVGSKNALLGMFQMCKGESQIDEWKTRTENEWEA